MRTRLSTALYIVVTAAAVAAQGSQPAPSQQPTFRAGANYVRVDMYATQDGQPVADIRPDEIELLEDGVVQKIEDFEYVQVRGARTAASPEPDGLAASREAAADPRSRVFVFFLDTYHVSGIGSAKIREPLRRFMDRVLGPDDLVALMTPDMAAGDVTLGRKTAVIARILDEEWWGQRDRFVKEDPTEIMFEACGVRAQLSPEVIQELIERRREKKALDALEDLMIHLGGIRDERKAVVLVSEGWRLYEPNPRLAAPGGSGPAPPDTFRPPVIPPNRRDALDPAAMIQCEADRQALALVDHQVVFRRLSDDANRGNVTFYPIDPRGLVVFDSGPDAPLPLEQDAANLRTRIENLRTLAIETDGEAILRTNNIDAGLKRIADDLASYYLFGYYSTNSKLDGRFRSITVRVKRPGVRVRARRGYRGRTAEDVVSAAAGAPDPARDAVTAALNTVAGLNARLAFRVRPAAWTRGDGASPAGALWVVGELDYRTRKELAWTAGAEAEVILVSAGGTTVTSTKVAVPAGEGTFGIQLADGDLPPGEYAARVTLRPEPGSDLVMSDTVRVIVPERPTELGEALIWRRGPSTGLRYLRTADPRFQRSERLRLELPASGNGTPVARMLDRTGKPLQVPVQVSSRVDADSGARWIVADAMLAPLAPGDYAVEVTLGDMSQVTGFRITP